MSKIEFLTQIIIKMKEKNYPSNFCVLVNLNAFCINCAIGRKTTCHGERPCASWPSLASRLLHPYRVRNDKSRVASVQTSCHRERCVNCHGEESFKTTRPSCFCHYERSEVIQKNKCCL